MALQAGREVMPVHLTEGQAAGAVRPLKSDIIRRMSSLFYPCRILIQQGQLNIMSVPEQAAGAVGRPTRAAMKAAEEAAAAHQAIS